MCSYGFYPLISSPTRITNFTSTLIDNIFINEINTEMSSGIMINDISDHLPIFAMIKCSMKERTCTNSVNGVNYKYIRQMKENF